MSQSLTNQNRALYKVVNVGTTEKRFFLFAYTHEHFGVELRFDERKYKIALGRRCFVPEV